MRTAASNGFNFLSDGRLATCGRDHLVKLWSTDGKQQGKDMPLTDVALRVAASPDGSRIIAGDWAGEIRAWSAADGKQLGTLSANPPKLAELLATATAQLAERKAEYDKLAAVAEASNKNAAKAADELTSAHHSLEETAAAEKTGSDEVANLQKSVDLGTTEITKLKADLTNQDSAAAALIDSVTKAQQAADKLPDNAELAHALARLKSASDQLSNDVAAAHKSLDDKSHELTANQEKLEAAKKHLETLTAETAATRQQAEKVTKSSNMAGEKAASDKQAADRAAQAVADTQKQIDRWAGEIEFAKVDTGK